MQAMKINQFDDKNMFFFTFSALFLLLCIFASTFEIWDVEIMRRRNLDERPFFDEMLISSKLTLMKFIIILIY